MKTHTQKKKKLKSGSWCSPWRDRNSTFGFSSLSPSHSTLAEKEWTAKKKKNTALIQCMVVVVVVVSDC